MDLEELTRNLSDTIVDQDRITALEAYALKEGGDDPRERYGYAGNLVKKSLVNASNLNLGSSFDERDVMYLHLREIEEECKLFARYDKSHPKNRDWPLVHHPNNLANIFLETYKDTTCPEFFYIQPILFDVLDETYDRLKSDHPWIVAILETTGLARLIGPVDSSKYDV